MTQIRDDLKSAVTVWFFFFVGISYLSFFLKKNLFFFKHNFLDEPVKRSVCVVGDINEWY